MENCFDKQVMDIGFIEKTHEYVDVTTGEKFTSVTTLVKKYQPVKDWNQIRINYAKKHGKTPEYWKKKWKEKGDKAASEGTEYHAKMEKQDIEKGAVHDFREVDLYNLKDGEYVEIIVYHKKYSIAGTIDKLIVKGKDIWIYDYKTNKKIDTESYYNFKNGKHDTMQTPIDHVMDCHYYHYSLQLSTYAYFLECAGYNIKALSIEWVKGKVCYILPYMKNEVKSILKDEYSKRYLAT